MNFPVVTLDQLRPILVGFRKSRGLTQAALAAKLGVAQQTYAQLEANPAAASVERLFRLLRVLGVELVLADTAAEPAFSPDTPYAAPAADAAMSVREPNVAAGTDPVNPPRKREAW